MTRVLVAFASKRGGTAGIAHAVAEALRERGLEVDCLRAGEVTTLAAYDAVVVGGALYMYRWVREARRFVAHNLRALRERPVWMFSSGPLDASASEKAIPPVRGVAALMAKVGARGHATFGGRLAPDATGFLAAAMARKQSGDWRDWPAIRAWALQVADALHAAPRVAAAPPRPARGLLAALCLLTATSAIAGGLALVARPDGSLLGMSAQQLAHTPFSSFLLPGLLLLVVIGAGNAFAARQVLRDTPRADAVAFTAGAALLAWIVAEMVLLRSTHGLQLTYLAIAVATMAEALWRRARGGPSLRHALAP